MAALAVGSVTAPLLTGQAQADQRGVSVEVVASGLQNPRDVTVLGDGTVLVAEAGAGSPTGCEPGRACAGPTGAIYRVRGDQKGRVLEGLPSVIKLPDSSGGTVEVSGPSQVVPNPAGGYTVLTGFGGTTDQRAQLGPDAARLGTLYDTRDGKVIADLADHETRNNPDGGEVFSNPWQFEKTWTGDYLVTDAGANTVVRGSNSGTSTAFALPKHTLPSGESVEAVPSGIARSVFGTVYVADMSGLRTGASRIWKVVPGQKPQVLVDGLSNIIDIELDGTGNLYALSHTKGFVQGPPLPGAIYKINLFTRQTTELATGDLLQGPTGMDLGPDGAVYVSNKGAGLGGELLRVTP